MKTDPAGLVLAAAERRGVTMATAESVTGGRVAAALTSVPGSSKTFRGGVVVYSDAAKTALADVDGALITEHGSVSLAVTEALAAGVQKRLAVDVAVAVTGFAERHPSAPADGGRVLVAVTNGAVTEHRFPGARGDVLRAATDAALAALLARLETW